MKRLIVLIVCSMFSIQVAVSSVFAADCPDTFDTDVPIAGMIIQLVNNSVCAFDQKFGQDKKLLSDIKRYKIQTDSRLARILNELTTTVKWYSESDDFQNSSPDLFVRFEQLNDKIYETLLLYPEHEQVQEVISPIVKDFEEALFNQFPKIKDPPGKSPLGGLFNFYKDTESQNPFGLAPFFELFFPKETGLDEMVELKETITQSGVETESIIFSQTQEFVDDELVYKKIIIDDRVVKEFKKVEDLTVFHGLPDQMRADGVNEFIVLLVQEYLNLINYRLQETQEELGIIVDLDHPQVNVPPGYDSDQFITNFINILNKLAG